MDQSSYDLFINQPRGSLENREITALTDLYTFLQGQFWEYNDRWTDGDPCTVIL
jgi:hypothetical protein